MRQRTRLQYKYDQQHKYNEIILHDIITNRSVKKILHHYYRERVGKLWGYDNTDITSRAKSYI